MKLILASNSPRRKEILKKAGYEFSIVVSNFEESGGLGSPEKIAVKNAVGKAEEVFLRINDKNAVVLGADTVVYYNNKVLGKPKTEADAVKTLKMLSGKMHKVVTGYAAISLAHVKSGYSVSEVTFNVLSEELIRDYVKSGLPMDKAGSYGIQDGFPIVKSYSGSLTNIIGLPDKEVAEILKEFL